MTTSQLRELIALLTAYGGAKFGDEWWPGHSDPYLPSQDAARLSALLYALDSRSSRWASCPPRRATRIKEDT